MVGEKVYKSSNAKAMRASYLQISNKDKQAMALADIDTAVAEGFHGAASDSVLEASSDWGFDFAVARNVFLWHGEDDRDVPFRAGQYLAEKTRGVLTAIEGENHTLIRRHWVDILTTVIEGGRPQTGKL